MKAGLVQDRLWALLPAKQQEIDAVIVRLLAGQKIDYEARVETKIVSSDPYYQKDAVAVISASGTLMPRGNLFAEWSGGMSTQLLKSTIAKALDDPAAKGIVIDFDSPGGTVQGTKDLADFIFENRERKPIIAYTDGLMCSAAYWIASAADSIVASSTSQVGSIGVVSTHYDMSKADEQRGVVRTEIYAGKYKRIAADTGPLTQEGREYLQERVDRYYSIFVGDVARNRGVEEKEALAMADGKLFIGLDALPAGLVDHIGNLDKAIELARREKSKPNEGSSAMTLEEMEAKVAAAEAKLAEVQAKAKTDTEAAYAKFAEEQKRTVELAAKVRRGEISMEVKEAVSAFKLPPRVAEAEGLEDFMMALDGLDPMKVEGKEVKPYDFFVQTFLKGPEVIEKPGEHIVRDGKERDTDADLEKLGNEIAAKVNPDLNKK